MLEIMDLHLRMNSPVRFKCILAIMMDKIHSDPKNGLNSGKSNSKELL